MDPVSNLKQALPYLLRHRGHTFVVAPEHTALARPGLARALAEDLSLLHNVGIHLVLACDAGDNAMLVAALRAAGTLGVAITGGDGALVEALRPPPPAEEHAPSSRDGDAANPICHVDPRLVGVLTAAGYVPVVGALAATPDVGDGDPAQPAALLPVGTAALAARLALALGAARLFFLTDRGRLLEDPSDPRSLVRYCDVAELRRRLEPASFAGGPGLRDCLEAAVEALDGGLGGVHLLDAHQPSAMLQEVFTAEGIGTLVVRDRHALDPG